MLKTIVIVGGGTAGWMTAGIIAAEFSGNGASSVNITLVESPDVATIGVGEGTWPSMRTTLSRMGISETQFIRRCHASFKQGSKFAGWRNGEEGDYYYHPFTFPNGYTDTNFYAVWQATCPNLSYGDTASSQGAVCEKGLAPKQITTPEYAGVLNYGYHLDAGAFATLLQEHCISQLGVKHLRDHVTNVCLDEKGYIESVETAGAGNIHGDLFVDCSGTHCLLLGGALGVPFVDQSRYSANDTALAVQVPYDEQNLGIASATIATAQSAGWTWDIGLSTRRGVGYVYSSSHTNEQAANAELRRYLQKNLDEDTVNGLAIRKIKIQAGHREKFWYRNCVAIGMSAGFIEPLEASALAMVELSANFIRDELPMDRTSMESVSTRFNQVFAYRWQRIIEFLKLHYVLSSRRDTDYWNDMVSDDTTPDSLRELLELWKHRPPYHRDLLHTEEVFPSASYQYVLYGMGYKTQFREGGRKSDNIELGRELVDRERGMLDKYCKNLPKNRELLQSIDKFGFKKV